jgi:hypothetical protein
VKLSLLCCGIQDEDKESDLDFSAESLGDYIFDELQLLGYDFNAIEFICGDNASCNPKLARLIGDHIDQPVPLIGCASHKLNLAVVHHVETSYQVVIDQLTDLCRQLRTLKNASKLRKHNIPPAIIRNDTRWSSLKDEMTRYVYDIASRIRECGFSTDVTDLVPSETKHGRLVPLRSDLIECHNVSMLLQTEGDERLDLFATRF